MADDRHYVPGDFYRICDLTGFKIRANRTKKQWNNYIVREQSFELRQPQDFVRGVRDDQSVPEPRPRQVNVFIEASTTVTASTSTYIPDLGYAVSYPAGSTSILVKDISIFNIGDKIALMQDDGTILFTRITAYEDTFGDDFSDDFDDGSNGFGFQFDKPTTFWVSAGNVVNNLSYTQQQANAYPASGGGAGT